MATILKPRNIAQPPSNWHLLLSLAFQELLASIGQKPSLLEVEQFPNAHENTLETTKQIKAYAKEARVIAHETSLEVGWWQEDRGSFLAIMKEDALPIVLHWQDGYAYLHPISLKHTAINQAEASKLEVIVYQVYPALPSGKITQGQWLKQGFWNCQREIIYLLLYSLISLFCLLISPYALQKLWLGGGAALKSFAAMGLLGVAWFTGAWVKRGTLLGFLSKSRINLESSLYHRIFIEASAFWSSVGDFRLLALLQAHRFVSKHLASIGFAFFFHSLLLIGAIGLIIPADIVLGLGLCGALLLFGFVQVYFSGIHWKQAKKIQSFRKEEAVQFHELMQGIVKLKTNQTYQSVAAFLDGRTAILQQQSKIQHNKQQLQEVLLYGLLCATLLLIAAELPTLENAKAIPLVLGLIVMLNSLFSLWQISPNLYELLQQLKEMRPLLAIEGTTGKASQEIHGNIEIKNLTFGYEPNQPIFKDFNLSIKAGSFVAITGASGTGKSTLASLICGLAQANSGEILVDGKPLQGEMLAVVQAQTKVLWQQGDEPRGLLFATVLGSKREELPLAKAWAFLELAGMKEEAENFPMKLQSIINENGHTLSGGQRQRLNLSNIFAQQAKIVILDESLNALDEENLELVLRNLKELPATKIWFTKKIAAVGMADAVFELSIS